jgi:branched-chain amino acid transport system permease protein
MSRVAGVLRAASTPAILAGVSLVAMELASFGPQYIHQVALQALVTGVLVIGLYVFVGNSGILSFGHLGFAMIGGYAGALLTLPTIMKSENMTGAASWVVNAHASPFFAVLIGGVLAAVVAVIVAIPLMRVSGLTAGLASFALLLVIYVVAQNWTSMTNGTEGLINVPTTLTAFEAWAWLVGAIVIAFLFQRSRFGLRLRAAREDEVAARALGVRVPLERGLAFVLSAFVMGAGGALYAMVLGTMSPDLTYLDLTLVIIAMLVVGGVGSLSGAVIGTIVISTVQEVLNQAQNGSILGIVHIGARAGIAETGLAIVLLVMLITRPAGIMRAREFVLPARWLGARARRSVAQPQAGARPPGSGGRADP